MSERGDKPFIIPAAIAASLVMTAIIGWMIEDRAKILREGHEVVLKVEPIDPLDLLRGRYVRLNYEIAVIDDAVAQVFRDQYSSNAYRDRQSEVYVVLEPQPGGQHQPISVHLEKPAQGIFIAARLITAGSGTSEMRVEYPLGRFYTYEKLAPHLEARVREGKLTEVVVALDAHGRAQIKAFKQGEETIFTERLY